MGLALPALLLSASLATACQEAAEARAYPHLADLPALGLEEQLRIGSLEDPDVGFSNVGPIWLDAGGEVFVQETAELQIRVYAAAGNDAGRLLRSYGRPGEGPGEFRSIWRFGVLGDTVWAADGVLHRLTLFHRSGELLATVSARVDVPVGAVPFATGSALGARERTYTIFPYELGPDGTILGGFSSSLAPNLPDSIVPVPRLVFDGAGAVVDTLEMVPTRVSFQAVEFRGEREGGGGATSFIRVEPPAFDSGTFRVPLRVPPGTDSLAVHWAVTGSPPVGVLTTTRAQVTGDTVWHRSLRYAPRPVEPGYLDSIAARRPRGLRLTRRDSLELVRIARSAMQMPPHHRPIQSVRAGEGGEAWIRLNEAEASANRWIVLSADGSVRSVIDLAPGAIIRWTDGDDLWVTERNDFEVPWLVRYRLVDPHGG